MGARVKAVPAPEFTAAKREGGRRSGGKYPSLTDGHGRGIDPVDLGTTT